MNSLTFRDGDRQRSDSWVAHRSHLQDARNVPEPSHQPTSPMLDVAGGDRDGKSLQLSDEQLLQQYIDGNRAAFALLLKRYERELFHFLVRFLGDRAAAEDVFQESFL